MHIVPICKNTLNSYNSLVQGYRIITLLGLYTFLNHYINTFTALKPKIIICSVFYNTSSRVNMIKCSILKLNNLKKLYDNQLWVQFT